jgi:hypothetical protein
MPVSFNLELRARSRGSSGIIVSDYGLDDGAIEVQSPSGAEHFSSSPCVQTGSEAHPASYPMGTGGPFPGGKAQPGVTLTTHPHLVADVKYGSPCASMACSGTPLPFYRVLGHAGILIFKITPLHKALTNGSCHDYSEVDTFLYFLSDNKS